MEGKCEKTVVLFSYSFRLCAVAVDDGLLLLLPVERTRVVVDGGGVLKEICWVSLDSKERIKKPIARTATTHAARWMCADR